ncbi:hypothetical protein SPADD19_00051 [Streptococcus parasanguinis]|nr:hypothetical protein SPADD19_00051 [Streptococcus parasanguinis]
MEISAFFTLLSFYYRKKILELQKSNFRKTLKIDGKRRTFSKI